MGSAKHKIMPACKADKLAACLHAFRLAVSGRDLTAQRGRPVDILIDSNWIMPLTPFSKLWATGDNSAGLKSVSKPDRRWRVGNITLSGRVTNGFTFWIRNGGHLGFNAMRE